MTPEQEREFRALLAEVDEENSGWRSVMDPVAAELRDLRAALAAGQTRETTYRAAIGEATELLGLSDPEGCRLVLHAAEDPTIRDLCELIGYGAVMDSAARQWRAKDGVGAHTTGMAVGTLKGLLEQLDAALADPSPLADALGRVARASVAATKAEWEPDRATLDQARIEQRAAVAELLAVAPWWGEPQGGG